MNSNKSETHYRDFFEMLALHDLIKDPGVYPNHKSGRCCKCSYGIIVNIPSLLCKKVENLAINLSSFRFLIVY